MTKIVEDKKTEGVGEERKFEEGEVVELDVGKGYVKEFNEENVYMKLYAFGLIIHGIFESGSTVSDQEYFGINSIYRDLMNELELCVYGKKTWDGGTKEKSPEHSEGEKE